MSIRLLFVDDEEGIRITLPVILRNEGFDVTVAASVPEALDLIARQKFDILLADLNIGQPGDGFTVVSAMRRTQPEVHTFILTGYPDFSSALEAIRQQVDDYFTKPADIRKLVDTLKLRVANPQRIRQNSTKRVAVILTENTERIMQKWLAVTKANKELPHHLKDKERIDHLPSLLQNLVATLESNQQEVGKLNAPALQAATRHGEDRALQGYTIPMLVIEAGILHVAISQVLLDSLLEIDLSTLVSDAMKIGEHLNALLEQSVRAFQMKKPLVA
jgi:YesN/AraC family two-component response regulator